MLSDGSRTMSWSGANELLSVRRSIEGTSTTTTFAYDPSGSRVLKSGPSGTTRYISGAYEVEAGSDGSATVRNYLYDGSELIATIETSGSASGSLSGAPQTGTAETTIHFTHSDHLGSGS
ncbi:hypothetical protein CO046_03950, partial [Candidatus Peregrinibacteria bacterium CG_4_9_14_0_2_um_filter_53_11]